MVKFCKSISCYMILALYAKLDMPAVVNYGPVGIIAQHSTDQLLSAPHRALQKIGRNLVAIENY